MLMAYIYIATYFLALNFNDIYFFKIDKCQRLSCYRVDMGNSD